MLCDVGHPLQGRDHRRRQDGGRRALDRTVLHSGGVPVQAERGAPLWEEGVTDTSRGRRSEEGDPRPSSFLHPEPHHIICAGAAVEIAVVDFVSGVQGGVELVAAVATVVILVTMEIDVRLLSDPGGRAWSPGGQEVIGQVATPGTRKVSLFFNMS